MESLDQIFLALDGGCHDGLVGDVGQRDLVLADRATGGWVTHNKHKQLMRRQGGGGDRGGRFSGGNKSQSVKVQRYPSHLKDNRE